MTRTMPRFYYVANRLLPMVMRLMRVNLNVVGKENVPLDGPLLMVANHVSVLDPPLVGYAMPRDVVFMSKAENFEGSAIFGWITRNYGAFPIRRGDADIAAIKQALKVLGDGRALFVAPEGTRHSDGVLGEPQQGVAMLAARANTMILPIGIHGGSHAEQRLKRWQPIEMTMRIGAPFQIKTVLGRARREQYPQVTDAIMEEIAQLLPEANRGRFGNLSNSNYVVK